MVETNENIVEEIIENKSLETISNVSHKESFLELEVKTICETPKVRQPGTTDEPIYHEFIENLKTIPLRTSFTFPPSAGLKIKPIASSSPADSAPSIRGDIITTSVPATATTTTSSNTNFNCLPLEIQLKIFRLLPSEVSTGISGKGYLSVNGHQTSTVRECHTVSTQNYSSLAAATRVCKFWRQLGEDPSLWKKFRLPMNSKRTTEELLEALKMRRFQSIRSIQFLGDRLLSPKEVQYGTQTKLET